MYYRALGRSLSYGAFRRRACKALLASATFLPCLRPALHSERLRYVVHSTLRHPSHRQKNTTLRSRAPHRSTSSITQNSGSGASHVHFMMPKATIARVHTPAGRRRGVRGERAWSAHFHHRVAPVRETPPRSSQRCELPAKHGSALATQSTWTAAAPEEGAVITDPLFKRKEIVQIDGPLRCRHGSGLTTAGVIGP